MSSTRLTSITLTAAAVLLAWGCLERPPGTPQPPNEPAREPASPAASTNAAAISSTNATERTREPADVDRPVEKKPDASETAVAAPERVEGKDPMGGKFTLADATATLPGTGSLIATIKTNKGDLRCTLLEDKAPNTVANFVGLARGVRPFRSHVDGRWVKQPLYDGTTFHRIIKGFMIQGGDPQGNGTGEPGYVIPDEIWPGARHDHPGQLCMANRGKNTNGAQFFVTDASVPNLDGNYTIFGECTPVSVIHAIASVPKDRGDRPISPVTIDKVEITRDASTKTAPPARP